MSFKLSQCAWPILLFWTTAYPGFAGEAPTWDAGIWTSPAAAGVASLKVQIKSDDPQVLVEFKKPKGNAPRSIAISLIRPDGEKTEVELKAVNTNSLFSKYQGSLAQVGPFIGFELQIPFPSLKKIESSKLVRVGSFGSSISTMEK